MSFYLIKTPKYIQRIFNEYIWCFSLLNNEEKVIYLTFDDGPTPKITEWTLDTLKEYNAKATFFCIGKNIENHPDIFKKIIADGHSIGNHTHNHLNGWKSSNTAYLKNIEQAKNSILLAGNNSKIKNQKSKLLFRPPYGKIRKKQAQLLKKSDCEIIMWDVLSADFDTKTSPKKCVENVINNVKNGSIIVFHDSIKASKNMKYALPKILAHFNKEGYSFKRIVLPN